MHFLQPRQLNKTRMVIDEFDGTFVDGEDVLDDFEASEYPARSLSDQKIHSGIYVIKSVYIKSESIYV